MKHLKKIIYYFLDKLTGTFSGFVIGMMATGLVSRYFETKSFKNLWGLTAKKKVVDKETFGYLEWTASIIIGFIAFEIVTKVIRRQVDKKLPVLKVRLKRWIIRHDLHKSLKDFNLVLKSKKIAFIASMYYGAKGALSNFSKK